MGLYATFTSLQTKMIGTNFDTLTTSLATAVLDESTNEINKYLSKRYDLSSSPFDIFANIPPVIRTISEWYGMGRMYEDMARGGEDAYVRADRYLKKAIANLEDIRDSKVDLFDTAGSIVLEMSNSSFAVYTNSDDYESTFNEDDPLNWKVDPDKLTDISSERG